MALTSTLRYVPLCTARKGQLCSISFLLGDGEQQRRKGAFLFKTRVGLYHQQMMMMRK